MAVGEAEAVERTARPGLDCDGTTEWLDGLRGSASLQFEPADPPPGAEPPRVASQREPPVLLGVPERPFEIVRLAEEVGGCGVSLIERVPQAAPRLVEATDREQALTILVPEH